MSREPTKIPQILAGVDLFSVIPPTANLRKVGDDRWRGTCPIGNHSKGGFSVVKHPDGHFVFNCFSCGRRGSVIDLYAALAGITIADAIRELDKGVKDLTHEQIISKQADSWTANQPAYVLTCDRRGCKSTRKVASLLDFAVLAANGFGPWTVCHDGSADCGNHA